MTHNTAFSPAGRPPSTASLYFRPHLLAILVLGFASGLPLALTGSTLAIWLSEAGISKASVGLFALIATPYTLKFFWAPFIDGVKLPVLSRFMGRRRSWLLLSQALLMAAIFGLSYADPRIDPWMTALAALFVAFFSATQDIVFDAYRIERLEKEEQAAGAAMTQLGYRLGMLASSAGALHMAEHASWQSTYQLMAALLGVGMVVAFFSKEPRVQVEESPKEKKMASWLHTYVVEPFTGFMRHPQWVTILLFVVLYKLADTFIGFMSSPFLIELGFTKGDIANIGKIYGTIATLIGGIAGGILVKKMGLMRSLFLCGVLQGASNIAYAGLAGAGNDLTALAAVITIDNFCGGMGSVVFVAYISQLCQAQFTATQYALLSSLAALGRTWLSAPAGWCVEVLGWQEFFLLSSLLALPGLLLLRRLRSQPLL